MLNFQQHIYIFNVYQTFTKKNQFNLRVHTEFAVCFSRLAFIRICITYSGKVIQNVKVQPLGSCLKFCTSMLLAQFCLDNKYKKCKAVKFLILIVSNKLSLKICFGVKLFENLIVTHFYNFKKLVGIEALKVKISLITRDSVHPLVHGILWLCVWLTGVVVVAEVHAKTWLPWLLLLLEW